MEEDVVLEKISKKIAEKYDEVKSFYYGKSDAEILSEAKKSRDYGNGDDIFISNGTLYSEISFKKFRVTTVLGYILHNGNFTNIVGIEGKNGVKLYEKFYPYQLRRMMMGSKLHEMVEKYASTLNRFSIEESLSAEIGGDKVVGRLDLATKDNGVHTIIDIKTGKLYENLVKIQLAVYAYMYSLKHGINEKMNIAVVSPEGVLRDSMTKEQMDSYLNSFIEAKKEMKDELASGKFYIFKRV